MGAGTLPTAGGVRPRRRRPLRGLLRTALWLGCCLLSSTGGAERTVTDVTGRTVRIPDTVSRTATLGGTPVLNSFLFALGRTEVIANGLPPFAQTSYWSMQRRLMPQVGTLPAITGGDGQPSIEALLALAPGVVVTNMRAFVPVLEAAGLPALLVDWNDFDDLMRIVDLFGEVFHANARAQEFRRYCEGNVKRVRSGLAAGTAPLRRPSAALLNLKTMSQPVRRLTDWALATVGSDNIGRRTPEGQTAMPLETLLRADPEVLVVWSRKDLEQVSTDPRFAHLSAVRHKRVHAVPVGAAPWLTPSAEYCLGILWLAQRTHPERFADLDLVVETREFYRRFYSMPIDARVAAAILAGTD